jgi:hypothetical protein
MRDIAHPMCQRRRASAAEDDEFSALDRWEIAETLTGTTRVLTLSFDAVVALAASATLADFMPVSVIPDPAIVALACALSVAVGIILGNLPARRPAHHDPIEALRHE